MRVHGLRVEVHSAHFQDAAADVEWLAEVGRRGWIVLTKDKNIRKRELERAALKGAGVHAFFLGQQGLSGAEMASIFAKAVPAMLRLVKRAKRPVLAVVHRNGSVARLD
ncbi:MAG: hypothetical protein M1314_01070 [Firmicutes bacterium]|nr:hypothetical protein [Bacillota bacterium]